MPPSIAAILLLAAARWLPVASDSVPTIEDASGFFAAAPAIAVTGEGATLLAWEQADAAASRSRGIYFRRREPGERGEWAARAYRMDGGPEGTRALEPRIALAGSRVLLAWQDDRTGQDEVYVRQSPDGGATWPGSATRLSASTEGSSLSSMISIAGSETGLVAAAWECVRNGTRDILFRRSTDFGVTWADAILRLDSEGSQGNGASYHPRVVLGEGDAILVVWWDERDGLADVIVRRSVDAGASWDAPLRLDPTEPGDAASRDAGIDARGNTVVVAWEDESGGAAREILTRASHNGGRTWSPAVRFPAPKWSRGVEDPRVALAGPGRAQVVWVAEPEAPPPTSTGPVRNPKKPAFRPDPSAALIVAAVALDSSAASSAAPVPGASAPGSIDPTTVPSASPYSRLAWIGSTETITWMAWAGTRVDPGGIDVACTTDGGKTWRALGLAATQNPEKTFVPVSGLTGAVDSGGALHLAWVQGRAERESVRFLRARNPVAADSLRE